MILSFKSHILMLGPMATQSQEWWVLNHRTLMMSAPSGIKVLAFVELPEHGLAILASRNTEGWDPPGEIVTVLR